MMIDALLEPAVLATVQSSLLILLVLAIRAPVARWLGARWAYFLWLAPLLGLIALVVPTQSLRHALGMPVIEIPAARAAFEFVSGTPGLVVAMWALGALFGLGYVVIQSASFAIRTRQESRELSYEERAIVGRRCAPLARRLDVEFRLLQASEGPAVAGILQPVLLLPADFFERFSERQQALMLIHELQHLCRRDLVVLFLARLYRCLFWFNPLAWLAERYVRLDQELSCDERVVSRESSSTRRIYGETMLLAAHGRLGPFQAGYPASFGQIRQRATLLRHHRPKLWASALGIVLLIAATGGSVVLGALGTTERDSLVRSESREAESLIAKAEVHYARQEYVASLRALVRAEAVDPNQYRSETWALRGLALAKLKLWDQALICLNRAIARADAEGRRPEAKWLLAQTALRLNQGDLEGAARSLDVARERFPDISFEDKLAVFNRLLQESWEPELNQGFAADF